MCLPPFTPSMTYNSHNGRVRSNVLATMRLTTSANCSGVPGGGTAWWRMW